MVALLFLPAAARAAGPFTDLTSPDYPQIVQGVGTLAASGSPRARPVLEALRDHRLYTWRYPRPDHGLFIKTASGFRDARTGRPVAAPPFPALRPVIVNDTVRSAISNALGMLDLF
ncbi:MAG: urea ABC transporter permease subunit UrtB, partial [Acetobacteraceae bacterium]